METVTIKGRANYMAHKYYRTAINAYAHKYIKMHIS